jgi:hypothetical protein
MVGGMLLSMIKLPWGQNIKQVSQTEKTNIDAALNRNFINLNKQEQHQRWPDRRPTHDAFVMCQAVKQNRLNEYLVSLEKGPINKVIGIFSGIMRSKSSGIPILCEEEFPNQTIRGVTFNPIQNIQGQMMAKITLLLIIESESQKLGIWNQLEQMWTEKYQTETKMYIQILEAIMMQCENSGQEDKAINLRNSIELIKESNRQYAIVW